MNKIIRTEYAGRVFGVDVRFFNVVSDDETGRIVNQRITARRYSRTGEELTDVELCFDDACGNGHETFSITGSTREKIRGVWREGSAGCIHDEIAKAFPELARLIKWHLTSTDGPMHYPSNVLYFAGDRDCWGLQKGEKRQILTGGNPDKPNWHLVAIGPDGNEIDTWKLPGSVDGEKPTSEYRLEWRPWCKIGEGKDRQLDLARQSAVWPEATDEQLSLPRDQLEAILNARLPALLDCFKADMLAAGFVWPDRLEVANG